jgi:hypothetical protein
VIVPDVSASDYTYSSIPLGKRYNLKEIYKKAKNVQRKGALQDVLNKFGVSINWKDDDGGETHPMQCRSDRTVFKKMSIFEQIVLMKTCIENGCSSCSLQRKFCMLFATLIHLLNSASSI